MTSDLSPAKVIPRRVFIKQAGHAAAATAILSKALPAFAGDRSRISLALVGGAYIHTANYLKLLKNRPDATVKCVWDHNPARAEKFAGGLGCPVAADLAVIWSDPEIKAVVICAETNRRRELVLAAAAARKHIFVEKPIGFTAAESRVMAAAIEQAKVHFATGYHLRADPAILFLKQQVELGNFGDITRVRGSNCHSGSLEGWFDADFRWMTDPQTAGTGPFGDAGAHSLDILMWLFGDVAAVTADIKTAGGTRGAGDESGEALLKFKNGITGTLAAGWVDVENPVTLLISGTAGHAHVERGQVFFASKNVPGANGRGPWTDLPARAPLPLDQFVDALTGKTAPPRITAHEAAARVSVMQAAYEAARTQAWVQPV